MKKLIKDKAGMSLLEITFATGILAVAFALLLTCILNLSVLRRAAETRQTATTHLATVMEEVRDSTYGELLDHVPPQFEGLEQILSFQLECFDGTGNPIELPVSAEERVALNDVLPDPFEVRITASWSNDWCPPFTMSTSALHGK